MKNKDKQKTYRERVEKTIDCNFLQNETWDVEREDAVNSILSLISKVLDEVRSRLPSKQDPMSKDEMIEHIDIVIEEIKKGLK